MPRDIAELIPAHRRAVILRHVRAHAGASIPDLEKITGASGSTVRRDLEQLEREGYLQRAHGGALLHTASPRFEPATAIAAEMSRAEKDAIAAVAARRVVGGQSVLFDSGSTVRAAARAIATCGVRVTAVTNDLGTGQIFSAAPEVETIVVGGTVRRGSLTLLGEPAQRFIRDFRADVLFLGTHAIAEGGLSDTSIEVAAMKRSFIAAARRVILLADADKFREAAFHRICDLTAVHELITDGRADGAMLDRVRRAGVTVSIAEAGRAALPTRR